MHQKLKKKSAAWESVTDDFNASRTTEKRTSIQLKRCWDKIKRKRKEELAEERRSRMITGGGESMPDKILIPDIDEVVPHLTEHVENPFDTDGIFESMKTDYTILDISGSSHSKKEQVSLPEDNTPSISKSTYVRPSSISIFRKKEYPDEREKCTTKKGKLFAKSSGGGDLNDLLKERIDNAKLERQHMIEIHEINKEEAIEKREEAKVRRQIADTELLIKKEELRHILLKKDE